MQFFAEFKKNILDEFDLAMHDGFSALNQGKKITFQVAEIFILIHIILNKRNLITGWKC